MQTTRRSLFTLAAVLAISGAAHAQTTYAITDIAGAAGINNLGQVTGTTSTANGSRIYRWSDLNGNGIAEASEMQILPIPSGYGFSSTRLTSHHLNNLGQVTGVVQKTSTTVPEFGYVWNTAGTAGSILTTSLGIQKVSTEAFGINDLGDVVGINYGTSKDPQCACFWKWTGSAYTTIKIANTVRAHDINAARQVIGLTSTGAFVWSEGGGLVNLGSGATAQSINSVGIVAGFANSHALLWAPSTDNTMAFTQLDLHPGSDYTSSSLSGLTQVQRIPVSDGEQLTFQAVGQVVSGSGAQAARWDVTLTRTSTGVTVTWAMYDLNVLVTMPLGTRLVDAIAISDNRQILCRYTTTGQVGSRTVLLSPQ